MRLTKILLTSLSLSLLVNLAKADVHLIIYATYRGKTGHAGIAVDDYKVKVLEYLARGKTMYRYDTIATGFVTYYDFWPLDDAYKGNYEGDVAPAYFRLPSSKWKRIISLKTLADEGIPHKEGYPCDGILTIPTTPAQDFRLIRYLNMQMEEAKSFNAIHYNCSDFVAEALTFITGKPIKAKEYIIKNYATTPNQLYKQVAHWKETNIYKDAGKKVEGSFVQQRILNFLNISIINY